MQTSLLRKNLIQILSFLILIFFGLTKVSFGQIVLTDEYSKDIRFILGTEQVINNSSYLLYTLPELIQNGNIDEQFDIREYSDGLEAQQFYYIPDGSQFISAGRIQSDDTENATFIDLSIYNGSTGSFSDVLLAFDFIYNESLLQNNYQLILQYRVHGLQWNNVPGSSFSTANFNSGDNEWDTFSVQLNLDDVYLRKGDELDLRWAFINKKSDDIKSALPLGLQRMEVFPGKASHERIEQGTLIITEILPRSEVDGFEIEYIELFNTSELPVSLKGLELKTSIGTVVVQHDMELAPYSTVLFSNVDMSGIETVGTYYGYPDQSLLPETGRVEISRGDQLIARAIYESQEAGQALELNRMIHAINGYSSLQNLIPSDEIFYSNIMGTPGVNGNSIPFYTRTLSREGWYVISLPGELPERFNRHTTLEFFNPAGDRLNLQQIEPYTTILVYKRDQQPVTLLVEPITYLNNENRLSIQNSEHGFRMASFTNPHSHNLWTLRRDGEGHLSPLVQVWDEQNQRFKLEFKDDYVSGYWSSFIINSDLSDDLEIGSPGGNRTAPVSLETTIPFRLYEGSGNSKVFRDEAIVGFAEIPVRHQNERFDLPKLTGSFEGDARLPRQSMLYLTSPESKYRANSFIHLPHDAEGSSRIGIGFLPESGTSGFASIEWGLSDDIPEGWTLKLEDLETGITVDMREVQNYRFRFTGEAEITERNNQFSGLAVLNPNIRNRFSMVIEPFEAMMEETEDEVRPGSVELRQNYPNPFNPATTIAFYLPEERSVKIGVYNIVGQQVALLVDETLQSGEHSVVWDAMNNPSGIYIVQMETGSRILTRKITLIK